jgi:hypothetical protein
MKQITAVLSLFGVMSGASAQFENRGPASIKVIEKKIISSPVNCSKSTNASICRETVVLMIGEIYTFRYNLYCPTKPGTLECPEYEECSKGNLSKKQVDKEAVKLFEDSMFSKQKKKLTIEEAKKIAHEINRVDSSFYQNLSPRDISEIEKFKNLSIDEQAKLIQYARLPMVGVVAMGAAAAGYAFAQGAGGFAEMMGWGGDRFKKPSKKKIKNDKEFDLKENELKN